MRSRGDDMLQTTSRVAAWRQWSEYDESQASQLVINRSFHPARMILFGSATSEGNRPGSVGRVARKSGSESGRESGCKMLPFPAQTRLRETQSLETHTLGSP